ncbi:MAG: hypothetical protein RIS80_788 [Actinomycetota bacterium]
MNSKTSSTAPKHGLLPSIALSLMTVISAVSALNIAIPDIAEKTGATQTQLTWIVDAYTVVFAGLLLLSGAVGDKYGRKTLLQVGLLIYLSANIFGILAGPEMDPNTLIAIRIITGVGASMIMPSTLSVITTSFEKEERAKAVGVWVAVAGGGAVVGLFGTAVLMLWFDWTSFFWLNLVFATVGFIGVTVNVRNSKDESEHPLDVAVDRCGSHSGVWNYRRSRTWLGRFHHCDWFGRWFRSANCVRALGTSCKASTARSTFV